MQYVHEMKISSRRETSIVKFLRNSSLLRIRAQEYEQSVIDYIADGFLPERLDGESYDDWVVRQVKETLEAGMMHDEMGSTPNPHNPHLSQRIHSVKLDGNDLTEIIVTFGQHPDVVKCWDMVNRGMTMDQAA